MKLSLIFSGTLIWHSLGQIIRPLVLRLINFENICLANFTKNVLFKLLPLFFMSKSCYEFSYFLLLYLICASTLPLKKFKLKKQTQLICLQLLTCASFKGHKTFLFVERSQGRKNRRSEAYSFVKGVGLL